jgi:predicted RNA-binding Zn ribbon-like protein
MMVSAMPGSEPSYAVVPPKLIGGELCLDFINTHQWRRDRSAGGERLTDYEELLHWATQAGDLDGREGRRLRDAARRRPDRARAVLAEALALREALARLFARPRRPATADLALVNRMLAAAPVRAEVVPAAAGFGWSTAGPRSVLGRPLWAVLWNGLELLTSARLGQVRTCADARCGWMFLDLSRNRTRRWCAMENCGNRAKVRRHYARRRKGRGVSSRA